MSTNVHVHKGPPYSDIYDQFSHYVGGTYTPGDALGGKYPTVSREAPQKSSTVSLTTAAFPGTPPPLLTTVTADYFRYYNDLEDGIPAHKVNDDLITALESATTIFLSGDHGKPDSQPTLPAPLAPPSPAPGLGVASISIPSPVDKPFPPDPEIPVA